MGKEKEKELDKALKDLRDYNAKVEKDKNDLLQFFVGLILLGVGVYMIFQNIEVRSNWGGGGYGTFFHIGSWNLPNGMLFMPLLIGIAMLFLMDRKIFGWIVIALGIAIVLVAVIMSVHIRWVTTSAYMFVMMFGFAVAGGAMVVRQLFKK